jgi:hypothetical protein
MIATLHLVLVCATLHLVSGSLRILTIGDSTDRYNLQDFCDKFNGFACNVYNETCKPSTLHPETIHAFFNFSASRDAWAIEICETNKPDIKLVFLFERTGVLPYCPWHWAQPGSEEYCEFSKSRNDLTMRDAFPALYGSAMPRLFQLLGGYPHAVVFQSHLWDVAKTFDKLMNHDICVSEIRRRSFIQSWGKNVTDYVSIVKEMFPHSPYLAWRTGNRRKPPNIELCKNYMMDEMNSLSKVIIPPLGIRRIEYSLDLDPPCRDTIHPSAAVTLDYVQRLFADIVNVTPSFKKYFIH